MSGLIFYKLNGVKLTTSREYNGGFSHSKRATLNVTTATWNTEVMAMQNGTEVYTGSIEVTEHDVIVPSETGTYMTEYTAIGVSGSEIGYVYIVNEDGTYGKELTQATDTTSSDTFTYATATKTLNFATGAVPAGSSIACAYVRKTTDNAQLISVNADAIPETVLVTAYGAAKDVCTGELFPCQVEGMAQVDANYTFELGADGEPAVQSLNLEFVKSCTSKKLYDFRVYTEEVPA